MGVPPGPDSQDRHLDANHYGPYLLTRLLLPAMGPGSRVVTVSSRAHLLGRVAFAGDAGQQQQPLQLTNHPWTW